MWFIDKLNVHQDHPAGSLPVVGSELVARVDLATGHLLSEAPNSKKLEGSYSSVVTVRCNNTTVSVQGNPSRWNRIDNLFGFTDFSHCVAVYNQLLARFNLPPFTKCTQRFYAQSKDGNRVKISSDGAIIDHVDFTRNFSVGCGNEEALLRGLSSQSIGKGKTAYLYPNCKTVDWYKSSTLRYTKVYKKSFDLLKNKNKRCNGVIESDSNYYQRLINWCDEIGLLREEHSFKGAWLRRKNLCFYGMTDESDFCDYLCEIDDVLLRLNVMKCDYETISELLKKQNIVKSTQSANATQAYALKWLHGMKLEINSQYYVHKARLKQIGIDISIPHDVTKMPPQIRSNRVIEITHLTPPDWYRMPVFKTSLKLVAA